MVRSCAVRFVATVSSPEESRDDSSISLFTPAKTNCSDIQTKHHVVRYHTYTCSQYLRKNYGSMRGVFQVLSTIAVMALAAAVDAYPGYAHNEFYPISAPSHEQEHYVSCLAIHVSQIL